MPSPNPIRVVRVEIASPAGGGLARRPRPLGAHDETALDGRSPPLSRSRTDARRAAWRGRVARRAVARAPHSNPPGSRRRSAGVRGVIENCGEAPLSTSRAPIASLRWAPLLMRPLERSAGGGIGVPTGTLSRQDAGALSSSDMRGAGVLRGKQIRGPIPHEYNASQRRRADRHLAALQVSRQPVRTRCASSIGWSPATLARSAVGQTGLHAVVLTRTAKAGSTTARHAIDERPSAGRPRSEPALDTRKWTPGSTRRYRRLVAGGGAPLQGTHQARLWPMWRGPETRNALFPETRAAMGGRPVAI